jgi:uncharacterized protein (TIGR03435 family)
MWRSGIVLSIALSAFGQNVDPGSSFDVADMKVNTSGVDKSSGDLSNGRLVIRNLPLRVLIAEAWTMNPDDVYGPPWLDDVRIDLVAKAASPQTPDAELRRMLQTLLKERMKLVEHIGQREKSVWALTVWKGRAKMALSSMPAKPEEADCGRAPAGDARVRLTCRHETMAAFAHELPQYAGGYVSTTVVDQTSLDGAWDFEVEWTPLAQIETNGGLTLFAALQAQLGLELAKKKLAVPVLVMDSVERMPTE